VCVCVRVRPLNFCCSDVNEALICFGIPGVLALCFPNEHQHLSPTIHRITITIQVHYFGRRGNPLRSKSREEKEEASEEELFSNLATWEDGWSEAKVFVNGLRPPWRKSVDQDTVLCNAVLLTSSDKDDEDMQSASVIPIFPLSSHDSYHMPCPNCFPASARRLGAKICPKLGNPSYNFTITQ
jgi:hypothetical protein